MSIIAASKVHDLALAYNKAELLLALPFLHSCRQWLKQEFLAWGGGGGWRVWEHAPVGSRDDAPGPRVLPPEADDNFALKEQFKK